MKGCGFCHPPADDTPEREAIDAFADFLRILEQAPRDRHGRLVIPKRAYEYAMGLADRPVEP